MPAPIVARNPATWKIVQRPVKNAPRFVKTYAPNIKTHTKSKAANTRRDKVDFTWNVRNIETCTWGVHVKITQNSLHLMI